MKCPKCGTENHPGANFCFWCGAALPVEEGEVPVAPPVPQPPPRPPAYAGPVASPEPVPVPRRFPILRVLSVIYKIFGGIAAAFTLLGAVGACIIGFAGGAILQEMGRQMGIQIPPTGGIVEGVILGVVTLLYGGFIALALYGMGEGISLFIAIEENTRSIAAA